MMEEVKDILMEDLIQPISMVPYEQWDCRMVMQLIDGLLHGERVPFYRR